MADTGMVGGRRDGWSRRCGHVRNIRWTALHTLRERHIPMKKFVPIFLLMFVLLTPRPGQCDEYWRGWCAGRAAALDRVKRQRLWFEKALAQHDQTLAADMVSQLMDTVFWQATLFVW